MELADESFVGLFLVQGDAGFGGGGGTELGLALEVFDGFAGFG